MLQRALPGWLRGEVGHCSMVAIPRSEEEDAKRPSCEREPLVNERTRLVNAMKADLTRLGIRDFHPKGRKATEQLDRLHTAKGQRSHPTRWPSFDGIWSGWGWLPDRSKPSRVRVWKGLNTHRKKSRMPW